MINRFTLLILLLFAADVQAQQMAQFTQFYFNRLYFSPSFAGSDANWNEFQLIHRSQWAGYSSQIDPSNAPTTTMFSATFPFEKRGFGVGVYFMNETLGPFSNQVFQLSGAWHKKLKQTRGTLNIGTQIGLYNKVLDFDVLRWRDDNDVLRKSGRLNSLGLLPDVALGLGYTASNYFVHASVQQLTQTAFHYDGRDMSSLRRHFFILSGYSFQTSQSIKLTPTINFKATTGALSIEGGLLGTYNDLIWAGFFYRQSGSVAAMAGLYLDKPKKFRLTYSFDYETNQQVRSATSAGSHEIVFSYRIPKFLLFERVPVRSPRFRHF